MELKTTLEEVALRGSYAIYLERKTPGWCLDKWRLWRPGGEVQRAGMPGEDT